MKRYSKNSTLGTYKYWTLVKKFETKELAYENLSDAWK